MEHKIHYTSQAHRDVDEIWGYIAYDLQNETAAYRVVNEIFDTIDEQLELFPESGARVSSVSGTNHDVRFLVIGKYLAFYRVVENEVCIDRILYGGRDYLRILFDDLTDDETE